MVKFFYVFLTRNGNTECHGSYSHHFGAVAKKRRLQRAYQYAEIEVVER